MKQKRKNRKFNERKIHLLLFSKQTIICLLNKTEKTGVD